MSSVFAYVLLESGVLCFAVGLEIQVLVAVVCLAGVDAKLMLLIFLFGVCGQDALAWIVGLEEPWE